MGEIRLELTVLIGEVDGELLQMQVLGLPELTCLGREPEALRERLLSLVWGLAEREPGRIRRALRVADGALREVAIELPARPPLWEGPLSVSFAALGWTHGEPAEDAAQLAYLPELHTQVIRRAVDPLEAALSAELVTALRRLEVVDRKRGKPRLARLAALRSLRELRFERAATELALASPRELAEAKQHTVAERPLLGDLARELLPSRQPAAFGVDKPLARLAELLVERRPRSVLLVGPPGVGKTALLGELLRRGKQLGFERPCYAVDGARLISGQSGYGGWQDRCERLLREVRQAKAMLHLGSLWELLEVGKSTLQRQGIASYLRPSLARGRLLAVAECLPEQLELIEKQDPQLLDAFVQLPLEEPDGPALRELLEACRQDRYQRLSEAGMRKVGELHLRYRTASALPGRPLRFCQQLLREQTGDQGPAEVLRAFGRQTGLPEFLLDEQARFEPEVAAAFFAERVIGQAEARARIVDVLATIKANLTRPRQPIASLLFVGPTGVGKTELASCLGEYLFGSRERLLRLDMSEYGDPLAAMRLTGGVGGEGVLTRRVRAQPFCVVLLDELEKADASVFDLLLQVLGDGRLTDAAGRTADFSNAVVIMTSNLGGGSFLQDSLGFADGAAPASSDDHFLEAVRRHVRPELFGRIDRVIPFLPLDQASIEAVARRELTAIQQRDGVRGRPLELSLGERVAPRLAELGHDPRYGARPLRRAVERELLGPLACELARAPWARPTRVAVTIDETGALAIDASALTPEQQPADVASLAEGWTRLRRRWARLFGCEPVRELQSTLGRLRRLREQIERRRLRRGARSASALEAEHADELKREPGQRETMERIERGREDAHDWEQRVLLAYHLGRPLPEGADEALETSGEELIASALELLAAGEETPDEITLALSSSPPAERVELARLLIELAGRFGYQVSLLRIKWPTRESKVTGVRHDEDGGLLPAGCEPELVQDHEMYLERQAHVDDAPGLALHIEGPGASLRLADEPGQQLIGETVEVLVERVDGPLLAYQPLTHGDRIERLKEAPTSRRYQLDKNQLLVGKRRFTYRSKRLVDALEKAVEASLEARLERLLEGPA